MPLKTRAWSILSILFADEFCIRRVWPPVMMTLGRRGMVPAILSISPRTHGAIAVEQPAQDTSAVSFPIKDRGARMVSILGSNAVFWNSDSADSRSPRDNDPPHIPRARKRYQR